MALRGRQFWPVVAGVVASIAVYWLAGLAGGRPGHSLQAGRSAQARPVPALPTGRQARAQPNYTLIEDGLYAGGYVTEPPPGTRAVLNVSQAADPYRAEVYRWSPIPDAAPAPRLSWLREQVGFVDAQRRAGRPTYVHCQGGVSRCGLVVVAYEMAHKGWSREEALAFVRARRRAISPNPAFMELLSEWENVLKGESQPHEPKR